MTDIKHIVCGWYTHDYEQWFRSLERDLLLHGEPYDFVARGRPGHVQGWEATTLLKAAEVRSAMRRHPDKVIIFIDVDCHVAGKLDELEQLRGDVGFFFHPRRKRSGRTKAHIRSGTMVLKPNDDARRFVDRWVELSAESQFADNDQDALLLALDTVGVTLEQLSVRFCKTKWDECEDALIIHDSASKHTPKISSTRRRIVSFSNWLRRQAAA